MSQVWTSRDIDILETLTRRVRLLTIRQIVQIWWPRHKRLTFVRRRLRRLASAGLLSRTIVNAHPPLRVTRPLMRWKPGLDEPDFEQVAHQLQDRWSKPSQPFEVFSAGRQAANLFGSSAGRLSLLWHRNHDLLLAQVYVLYRTECPTDAAMWIGEDALPKAGYRIKDPDAFLRNPEGEVVRVIESAGRYSVSQVERFHQYCAENELPYELW